MEGITLLIFHIIVIGAVVATTFIIAFSAGKKRWHSLYTKKTRGKGPLIFSRENIISN